MTDIRGFENSIKSLDLDIKNKNILLVGAGGIGTALSFYFLTKELKKLEYMMLIMKNLNNYVKK